MPAWGAEPAAEPGGGLRLRGLRARAGGVQEGLGGSGSSRRGLSAAAQLGDTGGEQGGAPGLGSPAAPPVPSPFPPRAPLSPAPQQGPGAGRCAELRGGRRRYKSPSPRLLCFPRSYKTARGALVTLTFRDLYDAFISLPSAMGCGQGSALILASSLSVSRSEQIPGSADSEDSSWGPTVCGCLSLSIIKDSCRLFPINSSAPSCARIWCLPRDAFGTEP